MGPRQFPRLNAAWEAVLATLDAPERYPLYVSANPVLNAGAIGMDRPFVVLSSAAARELDDAELRAVLGHELGHILSDHVLYKTMLRVLLRAGRMALRAPLTGIPLLAVLAGFLEWDRKSELSADRAGLLAVQDPAVARRLLLRMAAGVGEGADVEAFRAQARAFDEEGGVVDGVIRLLALMGRSHPFPVHRLREVDRWVEAGDYARILGGDYPRRDAGDEEGPGRAWAAWRASAGAYAEGVRESADPVLRWLRSAGEGVADATTSAWDRLRRRKPDGE